MATAIPVVLQYAAAAGTIVGAVQTYNAGIMQDAQAKQAATAEGDAARGREIQRRTDLLRALSSQNAMAGANGLSTDGSIGALARSDIKDASNDLLYDTASTQARQRAYRMAGQGAKMAGTAKAATGLLDGAVSGYKAFGGKSDIAKAAG